MNDGIPQKYQGVMHDLSTRRAHPKIIPPDSAKAVLLQYGAEEMKYQVTNKHNDAHNEQFEQVFKDTWHSAIDPVVETAKPFVEVAHL